MEEFRAKLPVRAVKVRERLGMGVAKVGDRQHRGHAIRHEDTKAHGTRTLGAAWSRQSERKLEYTPSTLRGRPEPRARFGIVPGDHHIHVAVVVHVEDSRSIVASVSGAQGGAIQQILIEALRGLAEG